MNRCPFFASFERNPGSEDNQLLLAKYKNFHPFLAGTGNNLVQGSPAPNCDQDANIVPYDTQAVLPFNLTGNILKAQDEIMNHGHRGAYATFYVQHPKKAPSSVNNDGTNDVPYAQAVLNPLQIQDLYSTVGIIADKATKALQKRVSHHRQADDNDDADHLAAKDAHVSIVVGFGVKFLQAYCEAYDIPLPFALIRDKEKRGRFLEKTKEAAQQQLQAEQQSPTGSLQSSVAEQAQVAASKLGLLYSDDVCNTALLDDGEAGDQQLHICPYPGVSLPAQGSQTPLAKLGVTYNTPYANTNGDVWFQIKLLNCVDYEDVDLLLDIVLRLDRLMEKFKVGLCIGDKLTAEAQKSCQVLSTVPDKESLARRLNSQCGFDICMPRNPTLRIGASRNDMTDPKVGGKILGCRFAENLNTVNDDTSLLEAALVGEEDPQYMGSSYAFVQSFEFDWSKILSRTETDLENAVGRKQDDEIIPYMDPNSHVRCSRVDGRDKHPAQLMRMSLPYDEYYFTRISGHPCKPVTSPTDRFPKPELSFTRSNASTSNGNYSTELHGRGFHRRAETGIYFVCMQKDIENICRVISSQMGKRALSHNHAMRDKLLSMFGADSGGFFFIPNKAFLNNELKWSNGDVDAAKTTSITRSAAATTTLTTTTTAAGVAAAATAATAKIAEAISSATDIDTNAARDATTAQESTADECDNDTWREAATHTSNAAFSDDFDVQTIQAIIGNVKNIIQAVESFHKSDRPYRKDPIKRRENPYLFYNHKDYLEEMSHLRSVDNIFQVVDRISNALKDKTVRTAVEVALKEGGVGAKGGISTDVKAAEREEKVSDDGVGDDDSDPGTEDVGQTHITVEDLQDMCDAFHQRFDEERKLIATLSPPTVRVLSLLRHAFLRWQSGWYVNREQRLLPHLAQLLGTKTTLQDVKVVADIVDNPSLDGIYGTLHKYAVQNARIFKQYAPARAALDLFQEHVLVNQDTLNRGSDVNAKDIAGSRYRLGRATVPVANTREYVDEGHLEHLYLPSYVKDVTLASYAAVHDDVYGSKVRVSEAFSDVAVHRGDMIDTYSLFFPATVADAWLSSYSDMVTKLQPSADAPTLESDATLQHISVRAALAMVMDLTMTTHDSYGFKEVRIDANGDRVYGADTLPSSEVDLIFGKMNNLGLGQGKILVDYRTVDEQVLGYSRSQSHASGIGHIVPDFSIVLSKGTAGVIAELKEQMQDIKTRFHHDGTGTGAKKLLRDEYCNLLATSVVLAGVQVYCLRHAAYIESMIDNLRKDSEFIGDSAKEARADNRTCIFDANYTKIANLEILRARAVRFGCGEPPRSFADAVNMLFILHSALHTTGEPTAFGRFDRYLYPFYANDMAVLNDVACQGGVAPAQGEVDPSAKVMGTKKDKDIFAKELLTWLNVVLPDEEKTEAAREQYTRNLLLKYRSRCQETVDNLWIKLGEKAQLNRLNFMDCQPNGNMGFGNAGGAYPQGGALNQWVQQLTLGGVDIYNNLYAHVHNGEKVWDSKTDAHTGHYTQQPLFYAGYVRDLQLFALRAARRLPLNAPCVSLRVCDNTPDEVLLEASKALLSGGAHPIIFDDQRIIKGNLLSGDVDEPGFSSHLGGEPKEFREAVVSKLPSSKRTLKAVESNWSNHVPMQIAMDWACDGCYEPQLCGNNWFMLGGFPGPIAVERAINQGMSISDAGPTYINGKREGMDTPATKDLQSYEEVERQFLRHYRMLYEGQIGGLFQNHGNMSQLCPAPLSNAFIRGYTRNHIDFYNGGPRYHLMSPQFTAIINAVDAMYTIKKLCFDTDTAITTLPVLVTALKLNWGMESKEPFIGDRGGAARTQGELEIYRKLRKNALMMPKFGSDSYDVNAFGFALIHKMGTTVQTILKEVQATNPGSLTVPDYIPKGPSAFMRNNLAQFAANRVATTTETNSNTYRTGILYSPGQGTFENYREFAVSWNIGASADGRLKVDHVSGDFTPSPMPADQPASTMKMTLPQVMKTLTSLYYTDAKYKAVVAKIQSKDASVFKSAEERKLYRAVTTYAARLRVDQLRRRYSTAEMTQGWQLFYDGVPADYVIPENTTPAALTSVLKLIRKGYGTSLSTFTTADHETFEAAMEKPERFDLLRVRTGGWSEFFVAMFKNNQVHYPRRQVYKVNDSVDAADIDNTAEAV